jgi:acyl-coenzyme A synthetase/AMP-(fatty) acid ligase/acyl carrier protein
MQWVQSAFHLQEADKFLQKTPFTFDASVWEIFAPLLAGAQLVMAEPEGHADPAYLITTINRYSITHLQVVPSLLQLLVADDRFTTCKSLKTLFCGGETLSADLVGRVSTALNIEIVNLYGPTETCINATFWAHSPEKQTTGVPIGLPTANLKVYVLDPYLNPVPVGAPGELYIGGRGLARGYLNRPELTAEKFIPNPFAKQNDGTPVYRVYPSPGDRLYRTGDLVRFLPDGNLDFLGRIDNQVKLRGFRIELGEIESILNQHPGVRQAVAIVKQERTGDSRLVVYLIPNPEASSDPAALTEYLKARLPAYMLPSAFVFLDAMPLTTSGKVDRRALPATATVHSPNLSSQDVPRTPLEQVLAGIFSQVLGVQSVGLYDNFFDLGGHSLLAIRLNSHITDVFKLEMPLRSIFEAPTVAELAERMLATPGESQRIEKAAQLLIEVAELSETEAYSRLDQIKKRSNQ